MKQLNLEDGARAIVIVAHPDDETIWLGGTMMKYPRAQWTVFSLCRANDADRAPKFQKVCQRYGAKALMADLDDEDKLSLEQTIPIIKQLLLDNLPQTTFDYLFTHGANGEYGHERHFGVHQAVQKMLTAGQLIAQTALAFNYELTGQKTWPILITKTDSDYLLDLSPKEFQAKKKIMIDLYGFAPDGLDVAYCVNPEGFKIIEYNPNTTN